MLKVALCTVGRTVVRSYGRTSKFFRLDGLPLFRIIVGLRFARCELRYKGFKFVVITVFINMKVPCQLFFSNCLFITRSWIQFYFKGNSSCNEKLLYYNILYWIGFRRAELRCSGSLYSMLLFNPLTPRSDQQVTSPYNIHTSSHKKVMRILKLIRQKLFS